MSKKETASTLFKQGHNCAQAVLCAFCTEGNLDDKTARRLAAPLGGGMGRLREVCGTVSGMFLAVGLIYADDNPRNVAAKTDLYEKVQQLAAQFKEQNGSIICRELLNLPVGPDTPTPTPRTGAYYQKRPCAELAGCAAEILENFIKQNPPNRALP